MYNFFTKNCIAPYADKFDNEFNANVSHCHAFDTVQAFGMNSGYDEQIMFFNGSEKLSWEHTIRSMTKNKQQEFLKIVNSAGVDRCENEGSEWVNVEDLWNSDNKFEKSILEHIMHTNRTLEDILNWKNTIPNYDAVIFERYDHNLTMNSCKACQMWVDDQTKAMVMCSCYRVMLPSLILFTVLTVILHFFSMYTDRTNVRKGKRKLNRIKTRIKTKITQKKVNGIQGENGQRINGTGMNGMSPMSPGKFTFDNATISNQSTQHTPCVIDSDKKSPGTQAFCEPTSDNVQIRLLEQYSS